MTAQRHRHLGTGAGLAIRPARDRGDRRLAAVVAVGLLVWLGLGLTFFADEWTIIADRAVTAEDLLRPFNEHWLAVTIVVYRAMLELVGMDSYVPYLALLAVLHAAVALLVYALVRRRTLPWVAVGITVIVLLFGSGFENLFWRGQIGFVGATALGLGALLLLDDVPTLPGPGRAAAATGLLIVAVMTSGYGLFMLGLVGLDLVLDPKRRKWAFPLLNPGRTLRGVVPDAWPERHRDVRRPVHVGDLRGAPWIYRRWDGDRVRFRGRWRGSGRADPYRRVGGWIVYLAVRRRSIPRRAIACLLAIAAEYTIVGFVRVRLEVDASLYTRYAYLSGLLALIAIGEPHP